MFRNMIMKRLKMEGFVILDFFDRYPEYQSKLADWMRAGRLKHRLHVVEGVDNAPAALKLLYTGGNDGKVMVRMS
jgi:NADPH-dependent curcumin reductase CurA